MVTSTGISQTQIQRPLVALSQNPLGNSGIQSVLTPNRSLSTSGSVPSQISGTWLQNTSYLNPQINNELKRISFFDLFSEAPQISKLFNVEFQELVKNIINMQETYVSLSSSTHTLENPFDQSELLTQQGLERQTSYIMTTQASDMQLENHLESSLMGVSNTTKEPINQNELESPISYNHTLTQFDSQLKKHGLKKQNQKSKNIWKFQDDEIREYETRNNKSTQENLTKNIVKYAIKNLNSLSLKLSKFV